MKKLKVRTLNAEKRKAAKPPGSEALPWGHAVSSGLRILLFTSAF
jgi:hypothetical protein